MGSLGKDLRSLFRILTSLHRISRDQQSLTQPGMKSPILSRRLIRITEGNGFARVRSEFRKASKIIFPRSRFDRFLRNGFVVARRLRNNSQRNQPGCTLQPWFSISTEGPCFSEARVRATEFTLRCSVSRCTREAGNGYAERVVTVHLSSSPGLPTYVIVPSNESHCSRFRTDRGITTIDKNSFDFFP